MQSNITGLQKTRIHCWLGHSGNMNIWNTALLTSWKHYTNKQKKDSSEDKYWTTSCLLYCLQHNFTFVILVSLCESSSGGLVVLSFFFNGVKKIKWKMCQYKCCTYMSVKVDIWQNLRNNRQQQQQQKSRIDFIMCFKYKK